MSPSPPPSGSDRNLLFGVLALQLDFISRDALVAAMNAWALDKAKSLGQVLCEQGAIAAARRAMLDALVEEHVQQHGGDVEVSLAAVDSHSRISDFLDAVRNPAKWTTFSDERAPSRSATPAERDGTRFGNLRFHAKGGLGQVFRADDAELNREVALKEIQPHRADDPGSRARFVREAEITGALEHPGVIPVYGLGAYPNGRPYYAMRFVRGESLKGAIDRYQASPTSAELRRLIGRLIDVCNAVGYAHSRSVVHRDLKPQNVMLGPFGETLVVDWGLAKAGVTRPAGNPTADATTDPTIHPASGGELISTVVGSALGTPGYMSPEQASGQHDTVGPTSDVFGLGATLYCLLTGRKPFEGTTVLDEITQTKNGVYPPPKTVNPTTPAALDAVCRKALAHEPKDRYPSALAMAADLEKWLADEPVAVYRDPPVVRAMRWGRRHRTAVAGTAVLLVTAVVASGVGMGFVWKEQQKTSAKKQEAENNFLLAQEQQKAAEENYVLARDLSEGGIELIATNEAQFAADPLKHKARKELLVAAAKTFRKHLEHQPDDPDVRRQAARVFRFAANVHRLEREYVAAAVLYADAVELTDDLAERFPNEPAYRLQLAQTLRDHASVQSQTGKLADALKTLNRSVALVEQLLSTNATDPRYRRDCAAGLLNRSTVHWTRCRLDEAKADAERASKIFASLVLSPADAHPYDGIFHGAALNVMAMVERESGRIETAGKLHSEAVGILIALAKDGRPGLNRSDALDFRSWLLLEQCRTLLSDPALRNRVESNLTAIVQQWENLAKSNQRIAQYREATGIAFQVRGQLRAADGRADEAQADFEKSREILEAAVKYSPDMPELAAELGRTYGGLARLARTAGDYMTAASWFDKAVSTLQSAVNRSPDSARDQRALEQIKIEMNR